MIENHLSKLSGVVRSHSHFQRVVVAYINVCMLQDNFANLLYEVVSKTQAESIRFILQMVKDMIVSGKLSSENEFRDKIGIMENITWDDNCTLSEKDEWGAIEFLNALVSMSGIVIVNSEESTIETFQAVLNVLDAKIDREEEHINSFAHSKIESEALREYSLLEEIGKIDTISVGDLGSLIDRYGTQNLK